MCFTYCIGCCELLLRADDAAASLCCVQSGSPSDDGLTLGARAAGLAADLGDLVPVLRHDGGMESKRRTVLLGWIVSRSRL